MSTQQLPLEAIEAGYRGLDLLVLDAVKIQAWNRILFVECGDGWIGEEAWRRAQRAYVCGLDTSAAHVDLAKRLREVPGKLDFRVWDGQHLPVPDGAFDRVVLNFTRTAVQDAAGLLPEARRVLQPSGEAYLLVSASCAGDLRQAMGAWPAVYDVARWDDPDAVLLGARGAVATASGSTPQKIV